MANTADEAIKKRHERMHGVGKDIVQWAWTREGVDELTHIRFELSLIRQALEKIENNTR